MRRLVLLAALAAPVLVGCGTLVFDRAKAERDIKKSITSAGLAVRSVTCPGHVKIAKGVVSTCTLTLQDGNTIPFRLTQTDSNGHVKFVQTEVAAEQVEHQIQTLIAQQRGITVTASCPNHVPVVVGTQFVCVVTDKAGHHARIGATIDTPTHIAFRAL